MPELDALDRLLADEFSAAVPTLSQPAHVAVIDDETGALASEIVGRCGPETTVTVWCDSFAARQRVLRAAHASPGLPIRVAASLSDALGGARAAVVRLPKSLDRLDEFCSVAAAELAPGARVFFGGRIKHMTLTMNEVISRHFGHLEAHLARQKSRVLVAGEPQQPAVGASPDFPRTAALPELDFAVVAHGGVFAGTKLDIGTRMLLAHLPAAVADLPPTTGSEHPPAGATAEAAPGATPARPVLADLGCGSGILATELARLVPSALVIATDDSSIAVQSARATAERAGVAAPGSAGPGVRTLWDDAAGSLAPASVDVIACNPPFHRDAAIDTSPALDMFAAAGRVLRPGGVMWTVFNRHLGYVPSLTRLVGPTRVVAAAPKFVVTRTVRR